MSVLSGLTGLSGLSGLSDGISKCTRLSEISPPVFDAITNQPGLYPCLVISNLDFDKRRKEKEKEEEEEKKFGNSKPRHFPKEMAEAKRCKKRCGVYLTIMIL